MKPLKEKINCQISSVKHPIGTVYLKKKHQPKTIMVFSSNQTILGISHSTPAFTSTGNGTWTANQKKKLIFAWFLVGHVLISMGPGTAIMCIHICSNICVDILYTSIRAYIPFEEPSRQSGSEKKAMVRTQQWNRLSTVHPRSITSLELFLVDSQIWSGWPNLAVAQPPLCCAFARHLVGKMVIYCSFAHHEGQSRNGIVNKNTKTSTKNNQRAHCIKSTRHVLICTLYTVYKYITHPKLEWNVGASASASSSHPNPRVKVVDATNTKKASLVKDKFQKPTSRELRHAFPRRGDSKLLSKIDWFPYHFLSTFCWSPQFWDILKWHGKPTFVMFL